MTALTVFALALFIVSSFWFLFRPQELKEREGTERQGDPPPETAAYYWIRHTMRPAVEIQMRELARSDQAFDIRLHYWILGHTRPNDLFATSGGEFEVMSAGRRMVAAPELYSNPYVGWAARDARRLRYIATITDAKMDLSLALCELIVEAGIGNSAYFVLPTGLPVNVSAVEPVLRGSYHSVYRVKPLACSLG